ncbi:sel1 repeat family protein [Marinobacter sp. R17]|nr:sel1 repeat family protein [Marinobacter sp. R17]
MMRALWLTILLAVVAFGANAAAKETDGEALYEKGYILYQQRHYGAAREIFERAAKAGEPEAAYYVGELERLSHTFMTKEAEKWYRQAAAGGDVYAMVRLANADICAGLGDCDIDKDEWFQKALNIALPKAKSGNIDSMNDLYVIYSVMGDDDEAWGWLNKAASNGHLFAQYWLSYLIEKGKGFYWTEDGRIEDSIKWMRKSAEGGFPRAMVELALLLKDQGDLKGAWNWLERASNTNYIRGIYEYAAALIKGPEGKFKIPSKDEAKGYALFLELKQKTDSDVANDFADFYKDKISSDSLIQAKSMVGDLLVDEPIIYYDPKFGL